MSLICKVWKPCTRRAMHSLLIKSKNKVEETIKNKLAQSQFVSITVDLWTDRRLRSFIGVTAHFINESFEFETLVLACKNVIVRHTALNIKDEVDQIIDSNDLRYLNIIFFTIF